MCVSLRCGELTGHSGSECGGVGVTEHLGSSREAEGRGIAAGQMAGSLTREAESICVPFSDSVDTHAFRSTVLQNFPAQQRSPFLRSMRYDGPRVCVRCARRAEAGSSSVAMDEVCRAPCPRPLARLIQLTGRLQDVSPVLSL